VITYTEDVPLAAIRAGNDAVFATLVEQHRPELRGYYLAVLGSLDAAEDVVQETLLQAWRSRSSFTGDVTFRTWLHRIATEVCRAWRPTFTGTRRTSQ
jgi:RNA polymerase sigma-70 factor, ECF subfamily